MQQKNRINNSQATLSKIIQFNDEISKRTKEDQLDYETEMFNSKFTKLRKF